MCRSGSKMLQIITAASQYLNSSFFSLFMLSITFTMHSQRFVPVRELGRGATSIVHLCRDTATDHFVVVKHISTSCYSKLDFENEVKLNKLSACDQIVPVIGCFATDDGFGIVLEAGESDLLSYIEEHGPLSETEARNVFRDMSRALARLHSKGVIHHDVKLDNMIVMRDGRVKLTDFGLAEQIVDGDSTLSKKGTFRYWCPELVSRKPHTAKADIWALGVCMFAALAGSFPFGDRGEYEYSMRVMMGRMDVHRIDHVSADLRNLIIAMLSKSPADRPSAFELMQFQWDAL